MASRENVEFTNECDICGCTRFTTDEMRGEMYCNKCGNVLEIVISNEAPREFTGKEARGHHGDAIKEGSDLGTIIGNDTKGVKDKALMARLRRMHKWMRYNNGVDRSMNRAIPIIQKIASGMKLSDDVVNESRRIYKNAIRNNLIRGRSINNVVTASLYAACRKLNVSRTLDEFSSETGIGRKNIGRTFRFLSQKLRLKIRLSNPEEYTMRFCSRLNLSGEVCMKSQAIIREAAALELTSGKGPTGITAASIYIASIVCHERRTQRDVANASGVTEVTIRNRYRELTTALNIAIEA